MMINIQYIGIGLTPEKPDPKLCDPDENTFNLGDHASFVIKIVRDINSGTNIIGTLEGIEVFSDEYDADEFIQNLILKIDDVKNIKPEVLVEMYVTLFNETLDEDAIDFIDEELGCELEIKYGEFGLHKEYGNSLFSYMISDTMKGVKITNRQLSVNGGSIDFDDIEDYRDNEDKIVVAVTSEPVV